MKMLILITRMAPSAFYVVEMYSRSGLPGTGGESMYVHIYQVALMESKAFSGNHKDQGEPLAVFPAL